MDKKMEHERKTGVEEWCIGMEDERVITNTIVRSGCGVVYYKFPRNMGP